MTVTDLLEDRVKLDGVLIKCNRDLANARLDLDCINARIAVERLASKSEAGEEAKRSAEFERAREQLRLQQDKARRQYDANTKVDVYHLPLIPVDPAPAPRNPDPPVVGQANQ